MAQATLPNGKLDAFEDCSWLFAHNIMNRGILRMDIGEAALLFKLARMRPNSRIVEIGRMSGGSTVLLAVAANAGGHVTSIDISPQDDKTLADVLEKTGLAQRVELVIADANTIEPSKDGYDLVFIDGDHSYEGVRKDYFHWRESTKTGGHLVFHDAWPNRDMATAAPDVQRLMSEIDAQDSAQFKRYPGQGSLAVFVRTEKPF